MTLLLLEWVKSPVLGKFERWRLVVSDVVAREERNCQTDGLADKGNGLFDIIIILTF